MKIVITGGCGFIGSSFVDYVYRVYNQPGQVVERILVVDKLTYAGNRDNIPEDVEFLQKDICDVTAEDLGDYNVIVNFAAETHVDNSIKDGRPFVRTNVEGTFNLLELARNKAGFRKFVQISTDEVYGDLDKLGIDSSTEEDGLHPSSYYSATKASADMLVQSCAHTYDLPYLIVRMCNNYGDRQHGEKFIPTLIRKIKADEPVPVYGDGQQKREWISVYDSVNTIYGLIMNSVGIYNIGSGKVFTNLELVQAGKVIRDTIKVDFVTDRKGHDRRYTLDSSKLKRDLSTSTHGWVIPYIVGKLKEEE